jgi:single-strand DNA-binding protein
MSGSMNKAILLGNVGQDPDIRNTQGGKVVASFTLATSESWKDRNTGEKKEVTQWHRIVVWNEGLVGIVENYVTKGTKLLVEGEIQTRKWEDQQGVERYTTEIVLSGFNGTIKLCGRGGGGQSDPNGNASRPGNDAGAGRGGAPSDQGAPYGGGYGSGQSGQPSGPMDDEIPF